MKTQTMQGSTVGIHKQPHSNHNCNKVDMSLRMLFVLGTLMD